MHFRALKVTPSVNAVRNTAMISSAAVRADVAERWPMIISSTYADTESVTNVASMKRWMVAGRDTNPNGETSHS